jgi:subtilisin family serine protease
LIEKGYLNVKKRNAQRREQSRRKFLGSAGAKPARARRSWTFELLEDRRLFSVTPLPGVDSMQWYAVSNSTPEGQALIHALELLWAQQATSTTNLTGNLQVAPRSVPTDPYFGYQWHLLNVGQVVNPGQFQNLFGVPGQDINVVPVWAQGITGAGVVVAVVDSGVQLTHPDLIPNLSLQWGWDALRNQPGGQVFGDQPHGTAVAGLIGAAANNGQGGVGVAYGATIVPIRFLGGSSTSGVDPFISAISAGGAPIDIYNHSWGPPDDIRSVDGPNQQQLIALTNSVLTGRNGLGRIHVWSAGNGADNLDSAGSDGYVNSRYSIGVGIVDHDGKVPNSDGTRTTYGELAPSVLVVAPSASGPIDIINNFDTGSGLFTTDLLGNQGYNLPPLPSGFELDIDTFPDPDYTTRFGGTSGAAPLVSGVIALMLQANPNLSWRDVQEILVRSARQNDDLDESWITNLVPLFRDPYRHTTYVIPGPPPTSATDWNDEIVWQLVPDPEDGIVDPAMQASTGAVFAANTSFTVRVLADSGWDGWVGNNLSVVFRTVPGDIPSAVAEIISPKQASPSLFVPSFGGPDQGTITEGVIRITVTGNGVTWGAIENAMDSLFDNTGSIPGFPFQMDVGNRNALFDPTDATIIAPLKGGKDATGTGSTLQRVAQYQGYNPIADPITNPQPPSLFTNGAGYTVSHGRGGPREYGWAHGVINAELAVELARQWHEKNQNLPAEKTYLVGGGGGVKIRAAVTTDEASGEFVIPGGLSNSTADIAAYFNEFFKVPTFTEGDQGADPPTVDTINIDSLPFRQDNPPVNTRGTFLPLSVPVIDPVTGSSNLMRMEWVEVQVNISGDADAMNYLRITLVSPDGTHSELTLNQFRPETIQNNYQNTPTSTFVSPAGSITNLDSSGNPTNSLNWVYSTNRIWGERSDSKPIFQERINPLTGRSEIVFAGNKNWELHFENYSGTDLQLNSVSVAFHGSPIGSSSDPIERIMGKVGVDSGRFIPALGDIVGANDGQFNFDRYVVNSWNNSHEATTETNSFAFSRTPFGQHEVRIADAFQEPFASNITVYAIDNITGQRIAEFLTGYDGNYYFDLPNNDVQASTGTITAQNTAFTVSATKNGGLNGILGNGITLRFALDPNVTSAVATFDGFEIFVRVKDTSVTWGAIENAIEALTRQFVINGQSVIARQFEVSVVDRAATFTASDANIFATLVGGVNGTYTIGIEDPLGRTALANGKNYDDQWIVRIDHTDRFTREAAEIDPITGKLRYFNDLNFLLDPGSLPPGQVIFQGEVIADLDGDGIRDPVDLGVSDFLVFADLNHSGVFELGEPFTFSDSAGNYELVVPTATPNTFSIGVRPPAGWTVTYPVLGFHHEYARPGDIVEDRDFFYKPPTSPTGIGNASIFGFIFNDKNGDGIQQPGVELGVANLTVFLDSNSNGELDPDEARTTTNSNGAYTFSNIAPGTVRVDVVINEPYQMTFPQAGYRTVTVVAGQVAQGVNFGVRNLATHDFGDLVGDGFHTYGPNAASHFVVPGFQLGPRIDGEVRSRVLVESPPGSGIYLPNLNLHGIGDDQEVNEANFDDEDGVVLVGGVLRPGTNTLIVTVQGVGGYLQGWIDFNNNGTFDPNEQVFQDLDINPGTYQLLVTAPQNLSEDPIAARFRWGTGGINFFGPDIIGEVEDYIFLTDLTPAPLPPGDYNGDYLVNIADQQLWKQTFGSTTDLRADGNGNGLIEAGDYVFWRKHAGAGGGSSAAAAATADAPQQTKAPPRMSVEEYNALRLQYSLEALQTRQAQSQNTDWARRMGAQAITIIGPNGPETRYFYSYANNGASPQNVTRSGEKADTSVSQAGPAFTSLASNSDRVAPAVHSRSVPPLELFASHWNATAGPATVSSVARGATVVDEAAVDSALLLLMTGSSEGSATQSLGDDTDDGLACFAELRLRQDERELELAAIFEKETNWRAVL